MASAANVRAMLVDRARSIAPLIEEDANRIEAETQITAQVHQALCDAGLIWIPLPRAGYAGTIAEDPVFRHDFARMDAQFHAARGRLIAVFAEAEAKVASGARLTAADHAVMRQTAT